MSCLRLNVGLMFRSRKLHNKEQQHRNAAVLRPSKLDTTASSTTVVYVRALHAHPPLACSASVHSRAPECSAVRLVLYDMTWYLIHAILARNTWTVCIVWTCLNVHYIEGHNDTRVFSLHSLTHIKRVTNDTAVLCIRSY